MGVICVASLKGGVGKTSVAVNIAHAFAQRMCRTLLIDLDPTAHTTRLFNPDQQAVESPLARLFLNQDILNRQADFEEIIENALREDKDLVLPARDNLNFIGAGSELRYFYWGRGARAFRLMFPALIEGLFDSYDHIVIDTPPDFNVLLRNAIAVSDLALVPVDSSSMSIDCLEELFRSCSHIKRPAWGIVRTMVNRSAVRIQQLSQTKLQKTLKFQSPTEIEEAEDCDEQDDISDSQMWSAGRDFVAMLHEREQKTSSKNSAAIASVLPENPIYLLNSVINRTEQQNRLTFVRKTAFDNRETAVLAYQYLVLAREIEGILSITADKDPKIPITNPDMDRWEETAYSS